MTKSDIALTDTPDVVATVSLRTVGRVAVRQVGAPRERGTVGHCRGRPVVAIDARGFMSCHFSNLQDSISVETKYKSLTVNGYL